MTTPTPITLPLAPTDICRRLAGEPAPGTTVQSRHVPDVPAPIHESPGS